MVKQLVADLREAAPGVMLERLCAHLNTLVSCGAAEVGRDGVITLVLREEEAAGGGMVTIPMYVEVRCPQCSGETPAPSCAGCGGTGKTEVLFSAWLAIKPGMRTGEPLDPTVQMKGVITPVKFRLRVRKASRSG